MIKNIRKNAFILLAITLIVLYFILKDDFSNIIKNLLTMNPLWLVVSLTCYILYIVFKSLAFHITVKEEKPDTKFKRSIIHNTVVQFFNGITPFSTGGQPMEVYMLKQQGIRYSRGVNIILQTFIFYQTALVLYGFLAVGLNYTFNFFEKVPLLRQLILFGFIINLLVVVILFIFAFEKKITKFLLNKILIVLHKVKIIKNKDAAQEKWQERIETFHDCAKHLKKNKLLFIKGVTYHLISLTFLYIIPLFLAFSMGDYTSLNSITAIVSSAYVLIMGSFVPIPGASGGIEYGFLAFFGNFISGSMLPTMLLIWRFITYYLGMIIGAVLFSLDRGDKKCE